jgi:hypothetical protein
MAPNERQAVWLRDDVADLKSASTTSVGNGAVRSAAKSTTARTPGSMLRCEVKPRWTIRSEGHQPGSTRTNSQDASSALQLACET